MTKTPYYLLDVFTESMYGGNQLAVFPNGNDVPENQIQKIASELNLSETVYLFPKTKEGAIPMRIFTPTMELPTAGHPTIGTAYFLANQLTPFADKQLKLLLDQKVGRIAVTVDFAAGQISSATMYQPMPEFGPVYSNRGDFARMLSIAESDLMDLPLQYVSCGVPYTMVAVNSLDVIEKIKFKLDVWEEIRPKLKDSKSFYVFTPSGKTSLGQVHGRMFGPGVGIIEDPATGSANGPLACYLAKYLGMNGILVSEQGFEMGRPSYITISASMDKQGNFSEVTIGGKSVFTGEGYFYIR